MSISSPPPHEDVHAAPARWFFGPRSGIGLVTAAAVLVADQALKLWLIFVYELGSRGRVPVAPFFDLILTWNTGISYGLFAQDSNAGRWILVAIMAAAVAVLWVWAARAGSALVAVSLGLIIGGAVGNGIDRVAYGAVADFVLFYLDFGSWTFHWYVFNIADAAIVVGVAGLIYDSLFGRPAAKAP